jgi:hypothetical protein
MKCDPVPPIPTSMHSVVDAAICLWDAIMEAIDAGDNIPLVQWREDTGAASVRQWCISNAHVVESLWMRLHKDGCEGSFDGCFDYEFVPLVLEACLVFHCGGQFGIRTYPVFRHDSEAILRGLIALSPP